MPKHKKSSSCKRRKSTIKLPLSVVIALVIIALVSAGVWAFFHPYEAKFYAQSFVDQIIGNPTRPATPVPTTGDYDNLAYGVPGPADVIINREGYALGYIDYHEQPSWVIYRMTREVTTSEKIPKSRWGLQLWPIIAVPATTEGI